MRYVINPCNNSNATRSFCNYNEEKNCTAGSGHGGGNYVNVEVGI